MDEVKNTGHGAKPCPKPLLDMDQARPYLVHDVVWYNQNDCYRCAIISWLDCTDLECNGLS